MALLMVILFIILLFKLSKKGKAYREQKRHERFVNVSYDEHLEREYRKALEKEGFDDDLITIILPVVMNGGK